MSKKPALKRAVQKIAEATGEIDKITKAWRGLPQSSSERNESETEKTGFDREIAKEKCISLGRRQH